MKRLTLLVLLLSIYYLSYGQSVNPSNDYSFKGQANFGSGVDTFKATAPSAWVQLGNIGTTKGLLMPRVFDTADIANPTDGLQCYQLSDHTNYSYKVNKWVAIGSGSAAGTVDTVSTIGDLEAYSGSANILLVTDSMRGGIFYKVASGYAIDTGVVFSSSDAQLWVRSFQQSAGVQAEWYGLNPYDANPDNVSINNAISSPYNNGIVTIRQYPTGTVLLQKSILIPSNTSLNVGVSTRIELMNGSNCYMIRNSDPYGGNENIKLSGGVWFGNGFNQVRVFGDSIQNTFSGMILMCHKCTNVAVSNVVMDTATSYSTWFPDCNNIYFSNSTFWGAGVYPNKNPVLPNGCAVAFSGNGLYVNNLYGFVNDDFITIESGQWGGIDSTNVVEANVPCSNINISDLHLSDLAGFHNWAFLGCWAQRNTQFPNNGVDGLTLSNCTGTVEEAAVKFASYPDGTAYFNNINISNLNYTLIGEAFLGNVGMFFGDINHRTAPNKNYFTNIKVSNCIQSSPVGTYGRFAQLYYKSINGTFVFDNITDNQTNVSVATSSSAFILDQSDSTEYVIMNNCANLDSVIPTKYLYYRGGSFGGGSHDTTHVYFTNCHTYDPNGYPFQAQATYNFSLSGLSVLEPTSDIPAPHQGDVLNDPVYGYQTYLNGQWKNGAINYGIFSFSGDGTTTSFTATVSPGFLPSKVFIQPTSPDAEKADFYVDPTTISSTAFTIIATGTPPPSGTGNGTVYYELVK